MIVCMIVIVAASILLQSIVVASHSPQAVRRKPSSQSLCSFDVDMFGCLNVNCNGLKHITHIPERIDDLIDRTALDDLATKSNTRRRHHRNRLVQLCSLDLSETGIVELSNHTLGHLDRLIASTRTMSRGESSNIKKHQERSTRSAHTLKIWFSNIRRIMDVLELADTTNLALFVRDSQLDYVQSRSLHAHRRLELSLINCATNSFNWLKMLEGAELRMLHLRHIPRIGVELMSQASLGAIVAIGDLKIYDSPHLRHATLDETFVPLKILRPGVTTQLEIVGCSLTHIQTGLFERYARGGGGGSLSLLRTLSLANNKLTRIGEHTFAGLLHLRSLDLDDNPIEWIEPRAFDRLPRLEALSMNNNARGLQLMTRTSTMWLESLMRSQFVQLLQQQQQQQQRSSIEISMKNDALWLHDICALNAFMRIVSNENSFAAAAAARSSPNRTSSLIVDKSTSRETIGTNYIRLFHNDQSTKLGDVAGGGEQLFASEQLICNANYICNYLRDVNSSSVAAVAREEPLAWTIESSSLCSILAIGQSYDDDENDELLNSKCSTKQNLLKCNDTTSDDDDDVIASKRTTTNPYAKKKQNNSNNNNNNENKIKVLIE